MSPVEVIASVQCMDDGVKYSIDLKEEYQLNEFISTFEEQVRKLRRMFFWLVLSLT